MRNTEKTTIILKHLLTFAKGDIHRVDMILVLRKNTYMKLCSLLNEFNATLHMNNL